MNQPTNARWMEFRNDSSEVIPAFALIRITNLFLEEDNEVLIGVKPSADEDQTFAANFSFDVPVGGFGRCSMDQPWRLLTEDYAVVNGESWKHQNNSWKVRPGEGDFAAIADAIPDDVGVFYYRKTPGAVSWLGESKTEITAADWTVNPPELGYGTVQPYNLASVPYLECPYQGEPPTETWYNMAPADIEENRGLVAIRWQGIKLIIVETCDYLNSACPESKARAVFLGTPTNVRWGTYESENPDIGGEIG